MKDLYSEVLDIPQGGGAGLADPMHGHTHMEQIGAIPASARGVYPEFGKRVFDLVLSVLLLPVVVPLVGLLAILVRLDGGPALFGHVRVGTGGRRFRCWKVRTMVPNAEQQLKTYLAANPEAKREWERDYKLTDDPRITRLGSFLRRTSLDELPQLWNVLRGDMSLVGPRPVIVAELAKYGTQVQAYLAVRPGVTGLWQVSGRNDIDYHERVRIDLEYLRSISLWRDISIIWRTVGVVLQPTGK